MRIALALALLVGCTTPDAKLTFEPSDGEAQSCGSRNCADVAIPCDPVVNIRVRRPGNAIDPLVPPICQEIPLNRNKDLCSIAAIDLGMEPLSLPKETIEVQILIWPRAAVSNEAGELDCGRHEVEFDVSGLPISQQPAPALGGRTFYHPGDEEIKVTLGCTDLIAVSTCEKETTIAVTATVENFENLGVAVSVNEGTRLDVRVGEPKLEGAATVHTLPGTDLQELDLTVEGVVPLWRADLDIDFLESACVQVLEDSAQATAAVRCQQENINATAVSLRGVQFPKATLDQILAALGLAQFPPDGITIGIVVDALSNPVAGQTVMTSEGTVRYLSANRLSFGGTTTTTSGIFVSLDAKFGTDFSVPTSNTEVGGLIQSKVTVVVIQK